MYVPTVSTDRQWDIGASALLRSPLFNVLAFSVFWAVQILITKLSFSKGAELFPFTIQSAAFSIVVMLLAVLPRCYRELHSIRLRILVGIVGANAIHNGIGGFLANIGTSRTSATNAAFMMQCSTVSTTLLAWLVLGEPLTRSKIGTVTIIIVGSFLLLTNGLVTQPGIGEVLLIFACISWSTGNVLIRLLVKGGAINPDIVSLLRPMSGLPVFLVFFAIAGVWSDTTPLTAEEIFQPNFTAYAAINGICCALVWIFLNRTLKLASASYMTAMCSLTPVIVAALAIPFLGERLSPIQFLGGFLIIGSSFIVHRMRF